MAIPRRDRTLLSEARGPTSAGNKRVMQTAKCNYGCDDSIKVVVQEARCSSCGLQMTWIDVHEDSGPYMPFIVAAECLRRSPQIYCDECGCQVLIVTEIGRASCRESVWQYV